MSAIRVFKRVFIVVVGICILMILSNACTCPPCPEEKVIYVHDTIIVSVPSLLPPIKSKVIL